jgi:dephospho-CoA kinase
MKVLGLTGGIGSGKSTVARLFQTLGGVPFLDADQVARDLRAPGARGHAAILQRFGTADRKALRELLTRDPQGKADLEAILHPLIREESERRLKELEHTSPSAPMILYEATLLIESGRARDFDGLIVVTAPLPDRLARIASRDGISQDEALALIESQSPDSVRLSLADYHIQNLGSLADLESQVRKILDHFKSP